MRSVMRHFLILATAIAGLTVGTIAAADCGALMPGTGPAQTLPSRQSGTAAVAVDLIALAATADQRQLAAALTAIPTQRGSFAGLAILLARRGGSRRPTVAGCRLESHGLSMGNLPATRTVSTPGPSRCFSLRCCSTRRSATPHRSAARRTVSGWTIAFSRRHAWIRTGCGTSRGTLNANHVAFAALGRTSWLAPTGDRSHVAPLLAQRVTESPSERIEPRSIRGLCDQLGLERYDVERVAALGKRRQAAAPM